VVKVQAILNLKACGEYGYEDISKVKQLPIDFTRHFETEKVICGGDDRERNGIEYATLKL
jgi:hypothetical protein